MPIKRKKRGTPFLKALWLHKTHTKQTFIWNKINGIYCFEAQKEAGLGFIDHTMQPAEAKMMTGKKVIL